jgi:mannosyltransferase
LNEIIGSAFVPGEGSPPRPPGQVRTAALPLALILILAAFLRFFRIGNQSFWADEVLSVDALSPAHYGLSHNFHGPLHAVLLQFWSIWGGVGDVWLRSLSAVLALLTIPLLYLLARRLIDHRTGLLAAFLLAVSPFHVWYSQEVRNYSLLILLVVLSQILFLAVMARPSRRNWILYGACSSLALLSNLSAGFLILAQGSYLLFRRRELLAAYVLTMAAVALLLLPWLRNIELYWSPDLVGQHGALRNTNFHPLAFPFTFSVFSIGFTVGPSLDELNRHPSLRSVLPFAWYFVTFGLTFGWLLFRGIRRVWGRSQGALFYAIWILVPLLAVSALAVLNVKVFNVRYVAAAFPAYIVLIAAGINARNRGVMIVFLTLVTIASGISLYRYYTNPRYWKPDARSAARYVEARALPGDAVRVYSIPEPFLYYYHGPTAGRLPWNLFDKEGNIDAFLDTLAVSSKRLWLIDYRAWYEDPEGKLPRRLRERWIQLERKEFVGVTVYLYEAPLERIGGR